MRLHYLVGGLLLVAACDDVRPPGADCGAEAMQVLVGRPAVDVAKFIGTQPGYVANNTYYVGKNEPIGPEIPEDALIARVSADHVEDVEDIRYAKVLSFTCNTPSARAAQSAQEQNQQGS